MTARATFDREADAVYVTLSDQPSAFGEDIDHARRVDYAADGTPIGIESQCASDGVDPSHLPHVHEVTAALRELGIRVLV